MERRSYSIYLKPEEAAAVARLKDRYMRSSTTDLIRFLIKAVDTGFFVQNIVDNQKQSRGRRAAANQ